MMKKIPHMIFTVLLAWAFFSIPLHAKEKAKEKSDATVEDREELNYGYAILYKNISDTKGAETLMLVKKNSEQVSSIAKEMSETLKEAKSTLEELQKKFPALDFGTRGQPEVIEQKNKMLKKEKTFEFFPFLGKTGTDFERTFLISSKFTLDQISKISRILSEKEKNPGIKQPLAEISDRTLKIQDKIEYLLNEQYYKENLNKKK